MISKYTAFYIVVYNLFFALAIMILPIEEDWEKDRLVVSCAVLKVSDVNK